jgi:hypothetical protein
MKKIIALMCKLLATGTMTLFIAACYGVMMEWKKTIGARDSEGLMINGLRVTLFDDGGETGMQEYTDDSGMVEFVSHTPLEGLTAVLEDVDGPENGGQFSGEELEFDTTDFYLVTMTRL